MPPKRALDDPKTKPTKKKAKKSTIINDFNRDYQASDADITLISADGIEFRVHSYVLKTISVVFRDMITIGSKKKQQEVALYDESFENSGTISIFLQFCYGKPLKSPEDRNSHPSICLVLFAQKYDCGLLIQLLSALTYRWCEEELLIPLSVFKLGYTLESPDLAAFALRKCSSWEFIGRATDVTDEEKKKAGDRASTTDQVTGASVLDPSGMSKSTLQQIPSDYLFALIRATSHQIVLSDPGKSNWKKISEDFLKIMKEMGKVQ